MPKINGTNANDVLVGSSEADEISAFAGDDVIYAGAGNDRVITGDGADTVYGADGDDEINGYPSAPSKREGVYTFWTVSGPLLIYGEDGDDFIVGSESADRLYGGAGSDRIHGRSGEDLLVGGEGDDSLYGDSGNDQIFGEGGDDLIVTDGHDTVYGGNGNDLINGYPANHLNKAGEFVFWYANESIMAHGDGGDDFIVGSNSSDELYGGEGQDIIYGRDGNDIINGGNGDDRLEGNGGNNHLIGGDGNDNLFGAEGEDTLDGGAGYDYLSGSDGNDTYVISDPEFYIYDTGGNDKAIVSVSFVKLPSNIEQVEYINEALPLPYWIDALIPGWGNGTQYTDEFLGIPKQFGYTFPKTIPGYDTEPVHALGYTEFNAIQKQNTISFLSYLAGIIDVTFSVTSDPNQPNVLAFALNTQDDLGGYAQYPNSDATGSDVFLNIVSYNSTLSAGTYGANVLVHEIGHALGLKHPFSAKDVDGDIADAPYLTGDEDHARWTMMSYTETSSEYTLTFSPLDIAALQYIYGVSPTARSGNDSYALSSSQPNFLWDGNGSDTVDASALSTRITLYLEPGYWGFTGAARSQTITSAGQVTVNFGTVLENILGSRFDDELHGNGANNSIDGGAGNDLLLGHAGNDTFIGSAGNDQINGGNGTDKVVYQSSSANTRLTWSANGWRLTAGTGFGTDTISEVELLQLSNKTVQIAQAAHASYSSISDDLWFFFLAAFNGAPGATYMDWMLDRTGNGKSIKSFVDVFITAPQFKDVYPESMSAQQFATKLVANTLKGTAAAVYEQAAVDKILNLMSSGATRSDVIYNAIGDMKWVSASSPIWGKTAQLFEKQKQVAKFYTDIMSQSTTDAATLRSVVANVSYDTDLSTEAKIIDLIGVSLLGNFDVLG